MAPMRMTRTQVGVLVQGLVVTDGTLDVLTESVRPDASPEDLACVLESSASCLSFFGAGVADLERLKRPRR